MAYKWDVRVGDRQHAVEMNISTWTGGISITVDGRATETEKRRGRVRGFSVAGHPATVTTRATFGATAATLEVEGAEVRDLSPPTEPIPGWAWLFVVACIAIPVVSRGGAIPAGIGAAGAAGCVSVARKAVRPVAVRAGICGAITAGAWGVFIGFAVLVARALR